MKRVSERGLAEWSKHPSSTFQVLGSIPSGSELPGVKKNPLASPHVKAPVKALPSHGYRSPTWYSHEIVWPLCKGGRGVFSACVRMSSSINAILQGRSYPRQAEFFKRGEFS
jgi:hypothetical protein